MTYEQIVDAALERVAEFGRDGGVSRATLYRRLGIMQSSLFQRCAQWNPDFYGQCIVGALAGGALDLEDVAPPLAPIGTVERIEVADAGTSALAPGTPVSIVPLADPDSGLAPRVTLRDLVVRQVGADLAGVTSLRVWYAKLSNPVREQDAALSAELRAPYSELLVLDLAHYLCRLHRARGRADVEPIMVMLAAELEALTTDFEAHVRGIALEPSDRFRRFGAGR